MALSVEDKSFRDIAMAMLSRSFPGVEIVHNVKVYPGLSVDALIYRTPNDIWAIEAKRGGNLFDALSRLSRVRFSPDVDEVYLAMPKAAHNDDLTTYASYLRVGLMLVAESLLEIPLRGVRANFSMNVSLDSPTEVGVASTFNLRISVRNTGEKPLLKTRGTIIEAFPFKIHTATPKYAELRDIMPGEAKDDTLIIETYANVQAGAEYPLLVKVESHRAPPYRTFLKLKFESPTHAAF